MSVIFKIKMSKKNKKQNKETTIENFYDLRTEAVDDLVEALKTGESREEISTNISEITGEEAKAKAGSKKAEFDPYRRDKLSALPTWLKAIFIKWWFAGCVCYFVMMGLGSLLGDPSPATNENLFLLTAIVYGVVVDVLVNPSFRYLESDRKEYNNYMMFPFPLKAFWTFFANIAYYFVVMILVNMSINGINAALHAIGVNSNVYFEPLLFGTLAVIVDMAFIGIKDLIVYLVKRSKRIKAIAAGEVEIGFDGQPVEQMPKAKGRRKGGKHTDVAPVEAQTQIVGDSAGGEKNLTDPVSNEEAVGEVDEIERLRKLAENSGESNGKNGKNKNKK
ncbi:MAG: hypothetical protein ACI4MQ_03540 [Candidatus Coproplasma sp.]